MEWRLGVDGVAPVTSFTQKVGTERARVILTCSLAPCADLGGGLVGGDAATVEMGGGGISMGPTKR